MRSRMGVAVFALLAVQCGGAPWFLGAPFDGRGSIPATTRSQTVADHRHKRNEAAARGEKVLELVELNALEERGALTRDERARLIELLRERARDWAALARPVPLADDLRHLVRLDPGRARALNAALRTSQRAAGDFWLALGENARAEDEYRRAARLGADHLVYRFRAAWGATPADLDKQTLERAIIELPERVLAPFTAEYLKQGGEDPRALRRAWAAARVYGPADLGRRLSEVQVPEAADPAGPVPDVTTPAPAAAPAGRGDAPAPPAGVTVVEPGREDRLLRGPTLARVLLPLLAAFPDLTAPGDRSRAWAEWLVAEDPTSPDSLEASALIDARAGRVDAAARKLGDLVFYSADRARGYAREAVVWERARNDRRACRAWERAALLGPVDDPRWCSLLACLRRDPGAGDAIGASTYIAARAPSLACETPPDPTPAPPQQPPADTADGGVASM